MANKYLTNAKRAKNDEFYTQYNDIQREIESYLEYDENAFRNKIVYCNCDDPYESNFFRYFTLNFNKLGLKKLITTSYKPSPIANTQLKLFDDDETHVKSKGRIKITANKFIINNVGDIVEDGGFTIKDIAIQLKANKKNEWSPLEGDGDFRSDECINLLKLSDIVVTNPPFSLFREYVKQLMEYNKKFIIIGNMNAITYKEIFPMIKENKIWLGKGFKRSCAHFFSPFKSDSKWLEEERFKKQGIKVPEGLYITRVAGIHWFTNVDHGRRHQPLPLMSMEDNIKFSKHKNVKGKEYKKYDNYDAIEVPYTDSIPNDFHGAMGVPISFLDKYSPEQFEILGTSDNGLIDDEYKITPGLTKEFVDDYYKAGGKGAYKEGNPTAGYYENDVAKMAYKRIFIKHKEKRL